jgi:U-box domain
MLNLGTAFSASHGVSYERHIIMEHLQKVGGLDPSTGQPLRSADLVPNLSLKACVEEFIARFSQMTQECVVLQSTALALFSAVILALFLQSLALLLAVRIIPALWTVTNDNFRIDFTYKSRPVLLKDNQADLPQLCPPVVDTYFTVNTSLLSNFFPFLDLQLFYVTKCSTLMDIMDFCTPANYSICFFSFVQLIFIP